MCPPKVKIYPPREGRALHELFQQILASKMSTHHKLSALYYLLLDHDDALGPRMIMTEKFALRTGMPKRYQIFMRGLWHMDRLQFQVCNTVKTQTCCSPDSLAWFG